MKKFEELRRCLEKYSEVNLVNIDENGLVTEGAWFEPSLILDLLADREQLKETIRFYANKTNYVWDQGSSDLHECSDKPGNFWAINQIGYRAREALKKSDEVEIIKEILE